MIDVNKLIPYRLVQNEKKQFLRTTFDMRADFRNELIVRSVKDVNNDKNYLPLVSRLESIPVLDDEPIVELNIMLKPEKRKELMEQLVTLDYYQDMPLTILNNSNINLKGYIHKILIDANNSELISEYDLYSVGNFFLYTIAGMEIDHATVQDILQTFRELMYMSNKNQFFDSLFLKETNYYENLDKIKISTNLQLNERADDFNSSIDNSNRFGLTQKRLLYGSAKILTSIFLSSLGIPPFLSNVLFTKAFAYRSTSSSSSNISDITEQ